LLVVVVDAASVLCLIVWSLLTFLESASPGQEHQLNFEMRASIRKVFVVSRIG
jgi:hypothetical protein